VTVRASVVVLNYNSGESIDSCVEKLLAQEEVGDFELVVVDNASTDGSGDRIERVYGGDPRFRLVRSPRNLGCAGGRNLGIATARGALVAFVDSDAWAEPAWLAGVLAATEPGAGIVASKLVYARNPLLLNGLGGTMNLQGYAWDLAFGEPVDSTELPTRALFACGNGLSVRREVIERIGGFDASYFNYYEDVDFCLRARRAGFELALASGAALHHYMGASDALNRNKLFLCERNR
jgi:N-acetylglucosaminyl-diphospho-decaprenol L-rhamnosyltransferase